MTLVHPAEDKSLSPALHQEANTMPQTYCEQTQSQDGTSYTCLECSHLSPSMDSFKKHMQSAHPKNQAACQSCDKVYKTVKSLRRHEKTHSDKTEVKPIGDLPCTHCPRKFSTQTALHWHEVRNHTEMSKTSTCQVCGKQLSDHASLKRHLEMIHSLETASCGICNKTFKSFTNLQRHVNVTHAPEDAAQTCNICNKDFKCSMHLRIHIRTVHTSEAVFSCDICSKEFLAKKYLLKHKKTHIDVKEFPCSICSKLFKSTEDVRKHTRRVHMKTTPAKVQMKTTKANNSVTCDICDKEFSLRKYMLLHKKTHINVRTFSCEFCDKLFKFASHVRKHTKRVHMKTLVETTGINGMFTCDICKKSFTIKKNMAKHIKIHYGRRDTPCGICDKLFKCNSDVNRHLKRVHMKGLKKKDDTKPIDSTKTDIEHTNTKYRDDAVENIEYTDNVFAGTKYAVKALEISEYTDEVPRSEDYRLETLRSAEYTLEILGSTGPTEKTKNTDFIRETLVSAEYTTSEGIKLMKEGLIKTASTQDGPDNLGITDRDLRNSNVIKDAIKISEISIDELENADEEIDNSSRSKKETSGSVESREIYFRRTGIEGKVIRNTNIIKDALDISDFKMEDFGVVEDAVDSIKIKEEICENAKFNVKFLYNSNTDIIRDTIHKSDFTIEDLGITKEKVERNLTIDTFGSITYEKEASVDNAFTDDTSGGANLIRKALRNTDIIREAIKISDFTMEDLGITEYTENVMGITETSNNTAMIVQTFDCTEGTREIHTDSVLIETLGNIIPESKELVKVLGSKDIIKEALNIADFTMEDLDKFKEEVSAEKLKSNLKREVSDRALVSTNFMESLYSSICEKQASATQNIVLESTDFKDKGHDDVHTIKGDIESSEFTMEDLELTEDALGTGYTMEDLESAEVLGTDFVDRAKSPADIKLEEVLQSTEITDSIGSTYSIGDALGNSENAKVESGTEYTEKMRTDLFEEALNETVYADNIISAEFAEVLPGSLEKSSVDATEFMDRALGNTDIIKEAIDNSEFSMEDLGITEYTDVLSTDYSIDALGMTECTDTITNMDLLSCLKCGVDFKNDVDLHTHLCGGEMTLFLDFQDM